MSLKPRFKVFTACEYLRDGKPLEASVFAVHLDDGRHAVPGAKSNANQESNSH